MKVSTGALSQLLLVRESSKEFDEVWSTVEEIQGQSLAAKKKLADDTKNFKKLPDAEKITELPVLLRGYQAEVDALTKRAKFSEAAFNELLKSLRDCPEPAVIKAELESFISSRSSSSTSSEGELRSKDAQISKLSETVRDLEQELKLVTNQAASVRRLEKQLKDLEANLEMNVSEARRQKDDEWSKQVDALRQDLKMRTEQHREVVAQLAHTKEGSEEQIARLQQQRLDEQRRSEEEAVARNAELETLSSVLERLQGELDRERLQHAEHKETQGSVLQSLLDGVQSRSAVLEREASELRQKVSDGERAAEARESELQTKIQELNGTAVAKSAEMQTLKEQLSLRPSVDEVADLRQQLRNVEAVEVSDVNAASTDLERRLMVRQRSLESQLSEARVHLCQLEREVEDLRAKQLVAVDISRDKDARIERLEGDLGRAARTSPSVPDPSLAALLPDSAGSTTASAHESNHGVEMTSMPSMLDIVIGQRDRYREKAGDLEQERDSWRANTEKERGRADALHADNVKLLERMRYVQSQSVQPQGGRRTRRAPEADLEDRYAASNEETLSSVLPFQKFREDEKARRIGNMNAGEKLLMNCGSLLFASKTMRMFTLCYTSTLHFLVFAVLYRLTAHTC